MSTSIYVLSRNDPRQLETFQQLAPEGVEVKWVDVTQPIDQQAAQLQEARAVIAAPSASRVRRPRSPQAGRATSRGGRRLAYRPE